MLVTYFGHSCFQVKTGGKTILFDPYISDNPLAAAIDIKKITPDYIFISHAHNDHIADALKIAKLSGAMLVANWEIYSWAKRQGLTNLHPMNIGGIRIFDFGKVKMVKAVHSSSFADGTYGGNPVGFYFETAEGNFYYAGDTALHNDMKLFGKHLEIDFAFLPIGNNYTMGVEDALIASKYIKCDKIIGMHYDTEDLIKIDHEKSIAIFGYQDKKLILMKIGEEADIK